MAGDAAGPRRAERDGRRCPCPRGPGAAATAHARGGRDGRQRAGPRRVARMAHPYPGGHGRGGPAAAPRAVDPAVPHPDRTAGHRCGSPIVVISWHDHRMGIVIRLAISAVALWVATLILHDIKID